MNEAGGVAHTIPDHEKLIRIGTDGFLAEISAHQQSVERGSGAWQFHEAMKISVNAFAEFFGRYHELARDLAEKSTDAKEKINLREIAATLATAPRKGASTFRFFQIRKQNIIPLLKIYLIFGPLPPGGKSASID